MSPNTIDRRTLWRWLALAAMGLPGTFSSEGLASQPVHTGAVETCAVVSEFTGAVQILNSSRTELQGAVKMSPVPCGSWISVGSGWIRLRHREGFTLHLSSGSFAQFPDGATREQIVGDSVVLYQGQVYGSVAYGASPLQMMTANGRVRIEKGSAILIYDQGTELTQLISLEGEARFANRFQASRKVTAGPGEATELSLKQLRVVPSAPKGLAAASIKAKFEELHLNDRQREKALQNIVARAERKFVSVAKASKPAEEPTRRLAGLEIVNSAAAEAASEKKAEQEKEVIQSHLARKVTGGEKAGEKILFPEGYHGKVGKAQLEVQEIAGKAAGNGRPVEDKEKQRIIEELSKLRVE